MNSQLAAKIEIAKQLKEDIEKASSENDEKALMLLAIRSHMMWAAEAPGRVNQNARYLANQVLEMLEGWRP
jgi:hypothetical protein